MASELACVYAALILHDDKVAISADKIQALVSAAGIKVEPYMPGLFAKFLEKRNVADLLSVGAAPAAAGAVAAAPAAAGAAAPAVKKEEPKVVEEEEEGGFGDLFG